MEATIEAEKSLLPMSTGREDHDHYMVIKLRQQQALLRRNYSIRFIVAQVGILVLYVVFTGTMFRNTLLHASSPTSSYTPARDVDGFGTRLMDMHLYKDNPYKGPPSPAVDAAWDNLFSNAYIRLSAEELAKMGRDSTLIQDDSGDYLGALDMYHQLHCVRFVFKYVHQDYYALNKINVPSRDHVNHCLDVIRQVVMCLGDTTISTFRFLDNYPKTWPEFRTEHTCRNWEAIDSWAGQPGRVVDQSDGKDIEPLLRNPDYVHTGHDFDGHGED